MDDDKYVLQPGTKYNLHLEFAEVPKYSSGKAVVYTVDEASVPTGYTKTVSGHNITNKHTPKQKVSPSEDSGGSQNSGSGQKTQSAGGDDKSDSSLLGVNDKTQNGANTQNGTNTQVNGTYDPKTGGEASGHIYVLIGVGLLAAAAFVIILLYRNIRRRAA